MERLSPLQFADPVYPTAVAPHRVIDGIAALYECLQKNLDPTWELYPRPFLNGDYPALAALHPIHGVTIFGIFPWNLRSYRCEQRGRYLRYYQRVGLSQQPIQSPVRQTEHYVENLINLYLPHIGESIARDRRSLSAFQVSLYFPEVNTHAAQVFAPIAPGRGVVFGQDALNAQELSHILPAAKRPGNRPLPEDWVNGLRFWLAPPLHIGSTHTARSLTEEQQRHVALSPGRHQRLHGVAGSGKTLVIAERAANLAAAGKRVLIITFNVTLWQYIRQLVGSSAVDFPWENIEFHHFHGFCKNFLTENGVEWPRSSNRTSKQALDEIIPQLMAETLQAHSDREQRSYDAILIDEGQDFLRSYYETLCHFLTANDEVLFVADRKQNLYLRDDSWLDNMRGTKFRGRWREMKESYRLPHAVATEVNRFADEFLVDTLVDEPASHLIGNRQIANSQLSWHNIDDFDMILETIYQTVRRLTRHEGIKPADIVILTPDQRDGWTVATTLEARGLAVNHILSADDGHPGRKQRRFRKRTFVPDDQRLKVSTIHGFKGWELNTVLLITPIDDQFWAAQSPYLFYVAMTRTRQNLIVFNRHPKYRDYGTTWNEHYHDAAVSSARGL